MRQQRYQRLMEKRPELFGLDKPETPVSRLQAEVTRLRAERDLYKALHQSSSQRADAYAAGISAALDADEPKAAA